MEEQKVETFCVNKKHLMWGRRESCEEVEKEWKKYLWK